MEVNELSCGVGESGDVKLLNFKHFEISGKRNLCHKRKERHSTGPSGSRPTT